jgi:Rrf2 family transcriptional regulator, iron-sulfur cluster assembly transcription factor
VLASSRGPAGGFMLARPAAELKLEEVVRHFDGVPSEGCLLGRAECRDDDPCAAHARWQHVAGAIRGFFGDTSLADLTRTHPLSKATAPG